MKAQKSNQGAARPSPMPARKRGVRIAVAINTGLRPSRSASRPLGTLLSNDPSAGIALNRPIKSG